MHATDIVACSMYDNRRTLSAHDMEKYSLQYANKVIIHDSDHRMHNIYYSMQTKALEISKLPDLKSHWI